MQRPSYLLWLLLLGACALLAGVVPPLARIRPAGARRLQRLD